MLSNRAYDEMSCSSLDKEKVPKKKRCAKCTSKKHLVENCPQYFFHEISRTQWKPYYSGELDRVICSVYENEKISSSRREELDKVMNLLHAAIRHHMLNNGHQMALLFELKAFGSTENGFGSNKSDLDVTFRYGENVIAPEYHKSVDVKVNAVRDFAKALVHARFRQVMPITEARVPVLKFATTVKKDDIHGDISYRNELALHNTRLLRRYCSWTKDDTLSKLGLFIKKWAKQGYICDASKGSLSSYTWSILIIHFLQRLQPHPLLPMLQEMGEKQVVRVDEWDVYFCDDEPKVDWSKCKLSVGELFFEFLTYYAQYDWEKEIVQIRHTTKLTKTQKGWSNLMCIQDPFELRHNLGCAVTSEMFKFIKKSLVTSRQVFGTLDGRESFFGSNARRLKGAGFDFPIPDAHIDRYGKELLAKCYIGPAPEFIPFW